MYRALVFCLISVLMFVSPVKAHTTPEELLDIQNVLNSRFIVEHICVYTIYVKSSPLPKKRSGVWWGTGFFIGHRGEPHIALTAGHVTECESNLPDIFFDKNIYKDNALSKEDIVTYEVNDQLSALYNNSKYIAVIVDKGSAGLGDIDIAVLNVILPKDLPHYHIPILRVENAYAPGSPVKIIGFIPQIGQWRLKSAIIEETGNEIFRVDTSACGGMSGGPVVYWHEGKYYAIGVVIAGYITPNCGLIDTAVATRLTKELIQKIDSKTAPK